VSVAKLSRRDRKPELPLGSDRLESKVKKSATEKGSAWVTFRGIYEGPKMVKLSDIQNSKGKKNGETHARGGSLAGAVG